jgi:flagellin-like hook-associated protein FlgL
MTSLETQYNAILDQIDYLVEDSGYAGINLLDGDDLEIAFDESGTSKITVSGFDASTASTGLNLSDAASWWNTTNSEPDSTVINTYLTALETAKSTLRTNSQNLSSQLSIVTTRQDFTTNMIDILEEGAGNLVNCDTTEEGVKLTTLQTQQALAVQSLSIASSSSQAVLNLFS